MSIERNTKILYLLLAALLAGLALVFFTVDVQCNQFLWFGHYVDAQAMKAIAVALALLGLVSAYRAGAVRTD